MNIDVLYVVEQAAACAWYRCRTPGEALTTLGYRVKVTMEPTEHELDTARLVIFERPSGIFNLHRFSRRLGKPVAVELDDDLWHIDPTNPAYATWNTHTLGILEACIRDADFVTVTTPALAATIRPMNRHVHILPNMLPSELWKQRETPNRYTLVIGWAGSPTHYRDLAILRGVIAPTLDRYPHVEFHVAGMTDLPLVRHDRIIAVPSTDLDGYPALVAGFDIGLAPVLDTRFNRGKSDLKAIEYAAVGIPVIASDCDTYRSLPRAAGFLCKTPADWMLALKRLIERPELRASMGTAARAWAETRFIEGNVQLWERAYGLGA